MISKQQELVRDPRKVEVVPTVMETDEPGSEQSIKVCGVHAIIHAAFPMAMYPVARVRSVFTWDSLT